VGYLETIFEAAERLDGDVDKPLKPARDFRSRADEMSRQVASLRAAEEKTHAALVSAIAAGKAKPAEAAKAAGTWHFDSPASLVLVHASRACHANADAAARSAGPAIFEALQARVAAVVAESVTRSVELPRGVDSEAKALRARNGDRKALDTWERLRSLVDEWTACHELARTMQLAQWIPGPSHARDRDGARVFERYQAPLSLPPGYWTRTPAELRLGVAQAAGAGPALIDWETAVQRWQRIDRRQRNYGSMEVAERRDSMGNVIESEASPQRPFAFVSAPGRP
jgi:hypothetical protein